jgi:predicted Rdx family selenoprotein
LAESLVQAFKPSVGRPHPIEQIILVPSSGGRYEITVDDELIYSKAATGQHTTNDYIIELVRKRLARSQSST